ncbi:SCO2584 family spore wall biosynthesis protein [Kitasatospora sp. NBC_00458]|uniref:SCO2584 family spore wall biosynthesis protein n=1 Tax=Kitasatospora sp. NBC_00458 TaxID=2903568 RepID=UPI002E17D6C5
MAEDVGGLPYPDGADHGGADDEFATVVFDEAFVRSAAVHEPTAKERQLAAAEARFEPDAAGSAWGYEAPAGDGVPLELRPYPSGLDDDHRYPDPWTGPGRASGRKPRRWGRTGFDPLGARRGRYVAQQRWHRPVAWVLAVIMGVGLIAIAVAAVYQGVGGAGGAPRRPESGSSSPGNDPSPPAAEPSLVVTAPAG